MRDTLRVRCWYKRPCYWVGVLALGLALMYIPRAWLSPSANQVPGQFMQSKSLRVSIIDAESIPPRSVGPVIISEAQSGALERIRELLSDLMLSERGVGNRIRSVRDRIYISIEPTDSEFELRVLPIPYVRIRQGSAITTLHAVNGAPTYDELCELIERIIAGSGD